MYFSMYWKLKFQISAHLKEKSRKIEKIFYGSQMFAENTLCFVAFLCWFTRDQILKLVELSKPFYSEFGKLDSEVWC